MNREPKRPREPAPPASETELFRATVGKVTPLRAPGRVTHDLAPPNPLPLQTWRDEQAALRESLERIPPGSDLETGEELNFVRPGIGAHVLRKLRRGHWIIQDELDLHGCNSHRRARAAGGVSRPLRALGRALRENRPWQGPADRKTVSRC